MTEAAVAPRFGEALKAAGWTEVIPDAEFTRGDQRLVFDTSSWIEVGTVTNPRIFDVPVPHPDRAGWTINLIDHLFAAEEAKMGPGMGARHRRTSHPRNGNGWLFKGIALAVFGAIIWIAMRLLTDGSFDFALPI